MKKSILGSMIVGSICVVLSVFLCVSVGFSWYVEKLALNEKAALLESNVDQIAAFTYTALTNQSKIVDIMFQDMIDNVSYNTKSGIMVFDNGGKILISAGISAEKGSTVSVNVSKPVLEGKKIVSTEMFQDENGDKLLTVCSALKNNGIIFGGVVFNQRVPEVKSVYSEVQKRLFVLIVIAMLFSAALFYFISQKITTPIKKISEAVTEFSKGDFSKRVECTSDNELGELAGNINHMADSLENLENLRRGFVSDVSHELRTPMTTISGFVEGILDGTIPEESRDEYLKIVLSESKRLSRLVTNLLQVSRMESEGLKINKTEFDINELMRLTLLKFEMMITPKNIDVNLNLDDGRLPVVADRDCIAQVLINLLNNAVKFTPEGGRIDISIENTGEKAVVEITNTGHGIEPEKLEYIWDRFYKTDSSRGMDRSGVGLGLYIVKTIIDKHGEKIKVESVVDDYTKFSFTLTPVIEGSV